MSQLLKIDDILKTFLLTNFWLILEHCVTNSDKMRRIIIRILCEFFIENTPSKISAPHRSRKTPLCTMNKTGSNTGHLTLKTKVQNFYFFYFVLVLNTIWKDFRLEKQMVLPYEPIYASCNMDKFCDFFNFAKITLMKNQLLNAILCLEAKY